MFINFPPSIACALVNTAQVVVDILCHDMNVAHVQLAVLQHPTWSFQQSCSPARQSLACTNVQGIIPSLVQDFAFVLVKFHQVAVGPFFYPV